MKPIVEKPWEYRGYRCAVLFQPTCHRCGYVEIPNGNKYFNISHDDIPVNVHSGLTYGRNYLSEVSTKEDGKYWTGWSYAYSMDCRDYESALEYYKDDGKFIECILDMQDGMECPDGYVYDLQDVIKDCKCVVDQLIELAQ